MRNDCVEYVNFLRILWGFGLDITFFHSVMWVHFNNEEEEEMANSSLVVCDDACVLQ